ncbi:uncharacterized protein LOC112127452 isoform X2 [Cimex lectularius]|uniref:Uncharacterized protein n=1 Tax=Cimex lectularius TaxID=79782 RepID=A0A8I6SUK4_CIMLE|nr:uncharacterized protein LOC112127452 isoform X2 [Cimex lectularius]
MTRVISTTVIFFLEAKMDRFFLVTIDSTSELTGDSLMSESEEAPLNAAQDCPAPEAWMGITTTWQRKQELKGYIVLTSLASSPCERLLDQFCFSTQIYITSFFRSSFHPSFFSFFLFGLRSRRDLTVDHVHVRSYLIPHFV